MIGVLAVLATAAAMLIGWKVLDTIEARRERRRGGPGASTAK